MSTRRTGQASSAGRYSLATPASSADRSSSRPVGVESKQVGVVGPCRNPREGGWGGRGLKPWVGEEPWVAYRQETPGARGRRWRSGRLSCRPGERTWGVGSAGGRGGLGGGKSSWRAGGAGK